MKIYKVNENAQIPEYATEGSACFDLRACFEEGEGVKRFDPYNKANIVPIKQDAEGNLELRVHPAFRYMIPTGLIFSIPRHHRVCLYARSGMAVKKGLALANQVGIIDSDYVDPVYACIVNTSDTIISIKQGDRIVQAALEKSMMTPLEETKKRPVNVTARNGGFGSTGTE